LRFFTRNIIANKNREMLKCVRSVRIDVLSVIKA
jgi:hypothetical protein